jgi:cell division protein FtsW (lipid II flippase)
MAQRELDEWWRRLAILTAIFLILTLFCVLVLFAIAAGAGSGNWLGMPAIAAVATILLPIALAVVVFQHAGWLERNDERHQLRDES